MKYVIVRNTYNGHLAPIIFPDELCHCTVVPTDTYTRDGKETKLWEADSAGFVSAVDSRCYGKSTSLNLKAKPTRDTTLIDNHIVYGFSLSAQGVRLTKPNGRKRKAAAP